MKLLTTDGRWTPLRVPARFRGTLRRGLLAIGLLAVCGRSLAAPAEIRIGRPGLEIPALHLLESQPAQSRLAVQVSATVSRSQLCRNGNLLLPCPAQLTPVRITVTVGPRSLRPRLSQSKQVEIAVAGDANFLLNETVELEPDALLEGDEEQQITVVLEHVDDLATGTFVEDTRRVFGPFRIPHFSGVLRFGEVVTALQSLAADPVWVSKGRWQIHVDAALAPNERHLTHTLAVPPTLLVDRDALGDLTVVSGAVEVLGDKAFQWSGWTGDRGLTRLTRDGFIADWISVQLPPGAGWRPVGERRLHSEFRTAGGSVPLNLDLDPVGPASGTLPTLAQFLTETCPVEFSGRDWSWRRGVLSLAAPETRFLRQTHYLNTFAATGELPESNDGLWQQVETPAGSDLEIHPGLEGGFSVSLTFAPSEYRPHFPAARISAPQGGVLRLNRNRAVIGDSTWPSATVRLAYGQGCRDPGEPGSLPGPVGGIGLQDTVLRFTEPGGLVAEGVPMNQAPGLEPHLEIGLSGAVPTHRTDPFALVRLYIPGTWAPPEDGLDSSTDDNAAIDEAGEDPGSFNPARYLLTGVRTNDAAASEHPGTPAYQIGAADYAGANFRSAPGLNAQSSVGGVSTDPYPLTLRSKYYARLSGVSGIHESSDGPDKLPAYGYDLTLTNFGLSLLSNEPHDSRIAGSVQIPLPSGFSQSFERLMLSCCGNLTGGEVNPGDAEHLLVYWSGTRFITRSLAFTHNPDAPCDTANALLELGITADVAHLSEQPAGFLYPRPDGSLVATDALERESHLALSAQVTLAGYPFMAVRRGYFNDHAAVPSGPGWINLAGRGGVSFFRDLEMHGHVLGSSNTPAPPLFVKRGWDAGGDTYFNQAGFDATHRGFPPGMNAPEYQLGTTHLPNARQDWFGAVGFDYPVRFDQLTRQFRSPEPKGVDLVVLETESQVERLNAELADLRFSAFLNLSLLAAPEFLVEEGASWITGQMEDTAVESIRRGLDRLAALLDTQMRRLLEDVVLPSVELPVVVPLVQNLPANGNAAEIDAALNQYLNAPLTQSLQSLANAAETANDLTDRAADALESATSTLETVRNVLLTLQQSEQFIVAGLERLGVDITQLPEPLRTEVEGELNAALDELELPVGGGGDVVGRLVEIRNAIIELEESLTQLIAVLEQGQQFFAQLQDTVFEPVADYANLGLDLQQRLGVWLKAGYALEPTAYSPEELRARVRQEIRDAFAASPVAARLQAVHRQWIYNSEAAVRLALDDAFQAINDQIVAVATTALEDVIEAVQPVKTFSSVVESVNWDGRAHIRNDRLTLLRLDNEAIVNVPTPVPAVQVPIRFTGFYEFRELTSDGSLGCAEGIPGRLSEILLGASAGPASMFGPSVTLSVDAKFTRSSAGGLLGLAGGLTLESQGLSMQIAGLDEFAATLSISPGLGESYLSAYASGRWTFPTPTGLLIPVEMSGGAFFGRTCTLDPLSFDPLAGDVLSGLGSDGQVFTGAYLFGEAVIPYASVGCVLNASLGAGARIFVNDPEFDFENVMVGGRLDGRVSGEFLCLAKLRGEAFLAGGHTGQPNGFFYSGGAELEGRLGICPICVSIGGGVQTSYAQGDGWNISY